MTRVATVAALVLLSAVLGPASPVSAGSARVAQVVDGTSTYSGESAVESVGINGTTEAFTTPGEVVVECDASACTLVKVPLLSIPLAELMSSGATVPMTGGTGTLDVPRGKDSCTEVPPASLQLEIEGDQLTLTIVEEAFEARTADCTVMVASNNVTFVGTRETGQASADDGSGAAARPGDQANSASGTSDAPVGPIAAGAAAVIVAAAIGVVLVRRARHQTPTAAPAAAPQVRPTHDPGRQTVAASGPSTSLRVRGAADAQPRITIAMTATDTTP